MCRRRAEYHFAEEGAFPGETSIVQLKAWRTHTLIGTRRGEYFARLRDRKQEATHALSTALCGVCIAKCWKIEGRQDSSVLKTQVTGAFAGIVPEAAKRS